MALESFLKEQDSVKNAIVNHYYFLYYSISSNCPRKWREYLCFVTLSWFSNPNRFFFFPIFCLILDHIATIWPTVIANVNLLQIFWALFSIFLEVVAIFPQFVLFQRSRNVDNLMWNRCHSFLVCFAPANDKCGQFDVTIYFLS